MQGEFLTRTQVAKRLRCSRSLVRIFEDRKQLNPTLMPGDPALRRGPRWMFALAEIVEFEKTFVLNTAISNRLRKHHRTSSDGSTTRQREAIMLALKRGVRNVGDLMRLSGGASELTIARCVMLERMSPDDLVTLHAQEKFEAEQIKETEKMEREYARQRRKREYESSLERTG